MAIHRVAIVGASSQIGRALMPLLAAKGIKTFRVGREASVGDAETIYVFDEKLNIFTPQLDFAEAVISLAPLPSIGLVLKMAEVLGAKRVIAFGSTGRFSKVGSASVIELDFVVQQELGEEIFSSQSEVLGISWTLFRPTMIYGAEADLNVTFIKSIIQKLGFFPMPLGANGLRQPVHVDDLAAACVSVLECECSFNRAYNLGGGEVLSFPELVCRIFHAEGKKAFLITIPLWAYSLIIKVAKRFPKAAFVRKEMVERMFKDLTVDNGPAITDFGFDPRGFSLNVSNSQKVKT